MGKLEVKIMNKEKYPYHVYVSNQDSVVKGINQKCWLCKESKYHQNHISQEELLKRSRNEKK